MHYAPFRWIVPFVLVLAIVAVWLDHARRAHASRSDPHRPPHQPRSHVAAAGILAAVLILSFIVAFLIP